VNPKPHLDYHFEKIKRLSGGRKAVTVCIAGINQSNPQPYIIAACDRKISFYGGADSAEGSMKISGINKDWSVMFSGPVSPMTSMIDAITERTKKLRSMGYRQFSRICRETYRNERESLIENEVLGDYDIDTYDEYIALGRSADKLDIALHDSVRRKIKDEEEGWSLLFAGFDKNRQAHIFTLTEFGKITYCDKVGFAAIGSGYWRASVALSSYPFTRLLPFSHAVFGILAAKFAAESADGVGDETILTVLEPQMVSAPVFWDHTVISLKRLWEQLPRFPGEEATKTIWQELSGFQNFGWLKNPKEIKS
jgi:hypothetical protein